MRTGGLLVATARGLGFLRPLRQTTRTYGVASSSPTSWSLVSVDSCCRAFSSTRSDANSSADTSRADTSTTTTSTTTTNSASAPKGWTEEAAGRSLLNSFGVELPIADKGAEAVRILYKLGKEWRRWSRPGSMTELIAGHPFANLVSALASVVERDLTMRDVSMCVVALSALDVGHHHPVCGDLLLALQRRGLELCKSADPNDASMLLFGLARLEEPNADLIHAILRCCENRPRYLKAASLASVAWSLAILKYNPGDDVFRVLLQRLVAVRNELKPRDASKVLWALATMQLFPSPAVENAVVARVIATAKDFNAGDISILLWALAASGADADPMLLDALCKRMLTLADECPARNICTFLWALTVLNHGPPRDSQLARALLRRIGVCQEDFTVAGMAQLHQYFLKAGVGGSVGPLSLDREEVQLSAFSERCRAAFHEINRNRSRQSAWQSLVARSLRSLCVFVEEEVVLEESGYSVDMVVLGRKLVIEVDGPDHFARPAPDWGPVTPGTAPHEAWRWDGRTRLKHQQLTKHDGYRVVHINVMELEELPDREALMDYFRDVLRKAGEDI